MPSQIKVDQIAGASGNTVTVPSGQTLDISSATLSLPSTVVTTTGTQTLTNKTIGVSQLTGTLPVANGGTGLTALGTAGQVIKVNSGATALEFGTAPSGKVLQVVSTVITGTVTISTNNSPVDITGLSATITPSSASNKILILYKINYSNASGDTFVGHLVRGSTNIFQGTGTGQAGTISFQTANMNNYWSLEAGGSFLDSPNTTSATTYKIQADNNSNLTMYFNRTARGDTNNDPVVPSSITLMEIGA